MSINIALCDDEKVEIQYLKSLAVKWAENRKRDIKVFPFESSESFLFTYEEKWDMDILLLDIQMKGMDGIELAKKLRCSDEGIQIIFITGFPDFVWQGYEVSALHYLLKPVDEEKLFPVLDKACKNMNKPEECLIFASNGENLRIPAASIMYAEAFAHTVAIHTKDEVIEIRMSLSQAEKLLGQDFLRCHRSYIAALKYIKKITKTNIILDTGEAVPLSRRLYHEVNQAFIRYFKE